VVVKSVSVATGSIVSILRVHDVDVCVSSSKQDKTMSVDGLRCILYARIYISYMRTIVYHYIQTGRPPVPTSSELKLKTNS